MNKWLERLKEYQASNPTQALKVSAYVMYGQEFNTLYLYLAKRVNWDSRDLQAWKEDLEQQPEVTMQTLRALKKSWDRGTYPVLEKWMFDE